MRFPRYRCPSNGLYELFKVTILVDQCRTPFIYCAHRPEPRRALPGDDLDRGEARTVLAYGLRVRKTPSDFSLHDGNHRVTACRLEGVEQLKLR
jgi:hypothetical protein